jgi:DNA polymerase III delta subunit
MSESRRGTIDALLNGDHEQFIKVFDEALKKGEEKDVDSVWGMMSYLDKLKEKTA